MATRRSFVQQLTVAGAGALLAGSTTAKAADAGSRPLFSRLGSTARLERAAQLRAAGSDYIVPPTGEFLLPDAPEAEFERQLEIVRQAGLPVLGCNIFLGHPRLRCVGPEADHPAVLAFAEIAFHRLAQAGGSCMGFGSGGARRLPPGWPKERADEQFMELLRGLAPIAARHNIVVAVEQLRAAECNYLNRLAEVAAVVAPINHPHIRVLADLFHMAVMGDGPAELAQVAPLVSLVEIAEKETRSVPGVAGDDFRGYFTALARGGYAGPITIEGNGSLEQLRTAFGVIRQQAAEALALAAG